MSQFNRVEFVTDINNESKVVAFVQCTGAGISFGQPKVLSFTDYPISGADNFERTTIHKDGKVVWHFNLMNNILDQKPPLAQWNCISEHRREFYDAGLSESYLPDP